MELVKAIEVSGKVWDYWYGITVVRTGHDLIGDDAVLLTRSHGSVRRSLGGFQGIEWTTGLDFSLCP